MSEFTTIEFYDSIADKYNWFFSSREKIMEKQTTQFKLILEKFNVKTIYISHKNKTTHKTRSAT